MPAEQVSQGLFIGDAADSMAPEVHDYDLVVNVTREVPFSKCLRPGQQVARFDVLDEPGSDQRVMTSVCRAAGELIRGAVLDGKKVLCHCLEGKQRSAAVVAAYLITNEAMHPEQAIQHVRACRPVAWDHGQYVHYRDALYMVFSFASATPPVTHVSS